MHNKPCLMWQITITIKPFAHPIYLINHDTPCDKDKPLNFFKRKLSELKNRLNAIILTGINEPDSRFLYCLGEKSKNILFLLLILCVHQTAEWKATLSDNHVVSKALFSMNAGSWKDVYFDLWPVLENLKKNKMSRKWQAEGWLGEGANKIKFEIIYI